jgi:transposase
VIATTENFSVSEAVAKYKELMAVEQGFRRLKDALAMRPIYHQVEHRVKAHIFVAALALLVQRFVEQRLQSVSVDLSPERAMQAPSTVRVVTNQKFRPYAVTTYVGVAQTWASRGVSLAFKGI